MNIAIIGAGLIGRLTALRLIHAGYSVTIYEAYSVEHPHGAVSISAGLIAPVSESIHINPHTKKMAFHSLTLWPDYIKLLQSLDPESQQIRYQTSGTLFVSFPEEQECLFQHRQKLMQHTRDYPVSINMLYNDEVAIAEPELWRYETAVLIEKEANIASQQFLQASTRALLAHARIIDHQPVSGDASTISHQYDWVIDCRGAGAVKEHTYAEDSGHTLTVIRGEVIRVRTDKVAFRRPVKIVKQRQIIYVAPMPNNEYIIGATDLGKEAHHWVTVRSSLELLSALYELHPGFAEAEIIEAVAGQRAMYADQTPCVRQHNNILCVNGLNRQGWLVSPSLVEQVMDRMH